MNIYKYLTNWKYRYQFHKLKAVDKMIEDYEFKKYKILNVREGVRINYDEMKGRRDVLEVRIKTEKEKPTLDKDEFNRLEDEMVILNRDIERSEEELKKLDEEVFGAKPSNENPEGLYGINDWIANSHDLKSLYKLYLKELK